MEPWEVMISEPGAMVAVVRPEMLDAVLAVCDHWELHRAVVGEVTDTGLLRALWEDEVVGEIPARLLTDECPRYRVEPIPREAASDTVSQGLLDAPPHEQALLASRLGEYPQPRAGLPPLRPPRRLARSVARGSTRPCSAAPRLPRPRSLARRHGPDGPLDPRTGGSLAVLEAARNVACTRCRAARAHRLPQLRQSGERRDRVGARRGDRGHGARLRGARRPDRLRQRLPHNETDGRPIDPTPVVGCVGLLEDVQRVPKAWLEGT